MWALGASDMMVSYCEVVSTGLVTAVGGTEVVTTVLACMADATAASAMEAAIFAATAVAESDSPAAVSTAAAWAATPLAEAVWAVVDLDAAA